MFIRWDEIGNGAYIKQYTHNSFINVEHYIDQKSRHEKSRKCPQELAIYLYIYIYIYETHSIHCFLFFFFRSYNCQNLNNI
jgi:hypothetical protein